MQNTIYEFLLKKPSVELIVVRDEKEAIEASSVVEFLGYEAFILPDFRASFGDDLRSFSDELFEITTNLKHFFESKNRKILISPIRTILNPLPKEELLQNFKIEFGDNLQIQELKEKFLYYGYTFVDVVETKGEVSFRGDIIDIFATNSDEPVRISLFDSEVEEIKLFDVNSQRSKDEIESIEIYPAPFAFSGSDYERIERNVKSHESEAFFKDIPSLGFWYLNELATNYTKELKSYFISEIEEELIEIASFSNINLDEYKDIKFIPKPKEYKEIAPINPKELIEFHKDKKVKLISLSETVVREFKEFKNVEFIQSGVVLNLIGKKELIISLNRHKPKRKKAKPSIILDELKVGEYVVHSDYGIGIFEGITQTRVLGSTKDVVSIKYLGDDKVLIPVENIDIIDRYVADSGTTPALDKLGKGSFTKLKAKVKEKLLEIASEIINIAAQREIIEGVRINTSFEEIKLFQNEAGFKYTDDQTRAIEDIFTSISSGQVMDRLLSGDVGFGKTEVAMNAMFAVAKSGYQSAMIAPTTLLSNQHFKSINERFKAHDIKIAKLDRFVTAKEKKTILKRLEDGELHVVIGTHSILGTKFSNLGLVVIDEEHKFGVKQKEKLKELKENCHILSMSATPIPRTLNLALSQIKTFSELLTPPTERVGVKTFVKEFSEPVVKESILRELRRGGQLFYIYNEIATIESKRAELLRILPNLKITILHSKISANDTEKEMLKFENGEYDLLLSTSIIESGIHMPKVNSIIVDGSDRFGIADLHQLRGRVGRGSKEGFCYFLVNSKENITEDAKKRLVALESNSYLGSGANLAYHDLQIRGGGNILGTAQSGQIKGVGYSLYLRMLEDALNALSGKQTTEKKEIDLKLTVNAFISPELVSEDRVRLEIYRRLGKAKELSDVSEIEEEIIDRFGKLDTYTKNFLDLIIIKILASAKGVVRVSNYEQNISFVYEDEKKDVIKSKSRDEDDILGATLKYLRK